MIVYFPLYNESVFNSNEEGDVKLYFLGNILNENINTKFFPENSTNTASTKYPLDLNQTFINASFSIVTLICDKFNTGGKSSKLIKTTLVSSEKNKYIWDSGENIVLEITTPYGEAWLDYLNNTFAKKAELVWDYDGVGAFAGDYYIITADVTDELTNIKIVINSIFKLECLIGIVEAGMG